MELNALYSIPLASINSTSYNTVQFIPTCHNCFHAFLLPLLPHTHFFFFWPAISLRQSNQSDITPPDGGEEESDAGEM